MEVETYDRFKDEDRQRMHWLNEKLSTWDPRKQNKPAKPRNYCFCGRQLHPTNKLTKCREHAKFKQPHINRPYTHLQQWREDIQNARRTNLRTD